MVITEATLMYLTKEIMSTIFKFIKRDKDKEEYEKLIRSQIKRVNKEEINLWFNKAKDFKFLLPKNDFELSKIQISKKSKDFWHSIIEKDLKSFLLHGEQGSGKTHFINQVASYINKEEKFKNYKIIHIKSWDYDFENKPFLLLLKKLYHSNTLESNDQLRLYTIIILFENQRHPLISQHLLIDIAKDFLFTCQVKDNKKILFIVDELERCHPKFAIEILEIITRFTGVELYIDRNNFKQDYFKNSNFFINNSKVIWVFDRSILNNVIKKRFGVKKNFDIERYFDKYFQETKIFWPKDLKYILNALKNKIDIEYHHFENIEKFLDSSSFPNGFFQDNEINVVINLRKPGAEEISTQETYNKIQKKKEKGLSWFEHNKYDLNLNSKEKNIFGSFLICQYFFKDLIKDENTATKLKWEFKDKLMQKVKEEKESKIEEEIKKLIE